MSLCFYFFRALSHFDEREFSSVANQLDLIPGLSPDSKDPDDILMTAENIQSPEAVLLRGEMEMLRALTHYHATGCVNAPVSTPSKDVTCLHPEL